MAKHRSMPSGSGQVSRGQAIQIAHDMLNAILSGELPSPYPERGPDRLRLESYAECLCWVLGHNDTDSPGSDFNERMMQITDYVLAATGRKLVEKMERHGRN